MKGVEVMIRSFVEEMINDGSPGYILVKIIATFLVEALKILFRSCAIFNCATFGNWVIIFMKRKIIKEDDNAFETSAIFSMFGATLYGAVSVPPRGLAEDLQLSIVMSSVLVVLHSGPIKSL